MKQTELDARKKSFRGKTQELLNKNEAVRCQCDHKLVNSQGGVIKTFLVDDEESRTGVRCTECGATFETEIIDNSTATNACEEVINMIECVKASTIFSEDIRKSIGDIEAFIKKLPETYENYYTDPASRTNRPRNNRNTNVFQSMFGGNRGGYGGYAGGPRRRGFDDGYSDYDTFDDYAGPYASPYDDRY